MIELFTLKKKDKYIEGIEVKHLKELFKEKIKPTATFILIKDPETSKYIKIDCVCKYYKDINGQAVKGNCKTIQRKLQINNTSKCLNCHKYAMQNFFDGIIK